MGWSNNTANPDCVLFCRSLVLWADSLSCYCLFHFFCLHSSSLSCRFMPAKKPLVSSLCPCEEIRFWAGNQSLLYCTTITVKPIYKQLLSYQIFQTYLVLFSVLHLVTCNNWGIHQHINLRFLWFWFCCWDSLSEAPQDVKILFKTCPSRNLAVFWEFLQYNLSYQCLFSFSPPSPYLPLRMVVLLSEPDEREFLMNPLGECSSNCRSARENINTTSRVRICCSLTLSLPLPLFLFLTPPPISSSLHPFSIFLSLFSLPTSIFLVPECCCTSRFLEFIVLFCAPAVCLLQAYWGHYMGHCGLSGGGVTGSIVIELHANTCCCGKFMLGDAF